ncbi:tRNA (34-2'-O)-methyltransferase regulator WDR6 isoform X2 [Euwallacea fornicatus]|uniref:tRNA (34-2'-O)-methyltransferase regulator WDR6 isoform X2 n=1 Tax=Euwallacea fornicatus TaxID=995702 RepID=UPI00338DA63B
MAYCILASVSLFNPLIEWGIGGNLQIYDTLTNNLVQRHQIFNGQNITGIRPNSTETVLIIYGGKHIALLPIQCKSIKTNFRKSSSGSQRKLSDWILDVKWIDNNRKFATVFMHNKIIIWDEDFNSEMSVKCEERCILYSAHLCLDTTSELIVLSGTVFSEILLWKPLCQNENGLAIVLKRLKQHKGVIFSINYYPAKGLICSASDDRSAILWRIKNSGSLTSITSNSSHLTEIAMECQVYGHLSRVFRCLIMDDFFMTAGEDSFLIFWNFQGLLLRKINTHQGGSVWALCYDSKTNVVCTGGNDGAVLTFKVNPKTLNQSIMLPQLESPKIIGLFKSGRLVCFSETGTLYYINLENKWSILGCFTDLQKYCIMQFSPCRKLLALSGFEGQIYIFHEEEQIVKLQHVFHLNSQSRIFSFYWLDCKTFLVSQEKSVASIYFLKNNTIKFVQNLKLPVLKEPWPTAACLYKNHIFLGDRKGNIHNYKIGSETILNSLWRAHNYLGVTCLQQNVKEIVSLGRDGLIKKYLLDSKDEHLKCIETNKTKFSWLAALESNRLLSFGGNQFIVTDLKFQRILFQIPCGGGHRSWHHLITPDAFQFSFIKEKAVHSFKANAKDFEPTSVIEGYHIREINCAKILYEVDGLIVISGGEDTILRISLIKEQKLKILQYLKVHLSSIRAMDLYFVEKSSKYLLVTGGGRAQIICWELKFDGKFRVTCKEKYNFYESLGHEDSETRIMDVLITTINDTLLLLAGRSDGSIITFRVSEDYQLIKKNSIIHSQHCITKLDKITMISIEILLTMATDGRIKFWSISEINPVELGSFQIHQSGITSISCLVNRNNLWLLSGGDDNCSSLALFALEKPDLIVSRMNSFQSSGIHCAQITGCYLTEKYFVTCSIDQRIIVSVWAWINGKVKFETIKTYNTVIADPQGLQVAVWDDKLVVCIYGNGFEVLNITLHNSP